MINGTKYYLSDTIKMKALPKIMPAIGKRDRLYIVQYLPKLMTSCIIDLLEFL